jgi:hypothetical protein
VAMVAPEGGEEEEGSTEIVESPRLTEADH